MRKIITLFTVLVLILSIAGTASAVDFQEELQKMAETNAKGYIGPFATAFGTAMNSGLYHNAKPHGMLGFDISIKMAMVTVADEDLTYDFLMPSLVLPVDPSFMVPNDELAIDINNVYKDRKTPTVFGSDEPDDFIADPADAENALEQALLEAGKTQTDIDNLKLTPAWAQMLASLNSELNPIPRIPGIGIDVMPFVMPQVSVGLIRGTEVMLRFIPETDAGDIGKVNFLGIGIKHNIDQWIPIPLFPVKISAQYVWQKLTVGDLLESNHTALNVHVSKTVGFGVSITPYLGLGIESSNLIVKKYTIDNPNSSLHGQAIDEFKLDGDNSFRMTVGARFALPLVTINADYSLGEYSTFAAGLGITFR
ncbi:MAG: hypothetical protein P9X24_19290 [Candidatus Hatepunaea meridiana]|nr:hypothetical protein [Candidatus Hatepunaea meridiana]